MDSVAPAFANIWLQPVPCPQHLGDIQQRPPPAVFDSSLPGTFYGNRRIRRFGGKPSRFSHQQWVVRHLPLPRRRPSPYNKCLGRQVWRVSTLHFSLSPDRHLRAESSVWCWCCSTCTTPGTPSTATTDDGSTTGRSHRKVTTERDGSCWHGTWARDTRRLPLNINQSH